MEQKNGERKNRIVLGNTASAVLLSWAGAIGLIGIIAPGSTSVGGYTGSDKYVNLTYTNSFFALLFWGLGVYVLLKLLPSFRQTGKREKIFAYVFSFLLSIALHFGAKLESLENVNFKDVKLYLLIILFAVFLAPLIHSLWNEILTFTAKNDGKKNENKPLKLTRIWLVIFALWIPTFLAFFPGAFVYDAMDEYVQVISRQFTMHHPLLHVLALGGIIHTFEYIGLGANAGIAVYTLLQMGICSWVAAYFVVVLQKLGAAKKYLLGIILIIGLFPVFPMYAVCTAKDTLFTAALLMVVLLILQCAIEEKTFFDKKMILFVAASVIMMLLRNNGMYAYLVAIPFIALCMKAAGNGKGVIVRLVVLMLLSVFMFFGGRYCLKLICHAIDNEHQEMLTVPIQQLARVYKYSPESFSEEEKDILYEVLPQNYLETYTPRCSDILKSGFDNDAYEKNPERYRKLWWEIGKKKPYVYINAWLVNCYGYWYPDMIINVYGGNQMYTFKYVDSSYFGFETEPPGERKSLFPIYERFYRNISLELFQQRVPVMSMLFSPGFMFVLFAFFFVGMMRDKMWKQLTAVIPVFFLWCTVLLGPTVLVRYVLILWFMVLIMPVVFVKGHKQKKEIIEDVK